MILLDWQLEGDAQGFDALQLIRDRGWDAPLVMMTAHSDEIADRSECEARGVADLLRKPFQKRELVGASNKALDLNLEV